MHWPIIIIIVVGLRVHGVLTDVCVLLLRCINRVVFLVHLLRHVWLARVYVVALGEHLSS
jgi:hypothetical protein